MTEVPSEADVERIVVRCERVTVSPPWVRWWRANVRPAEPTDLPAGESLLRDEQGLAVFRRPEKDDRWVSRIGMVWHAVYEPDPDYFDGRRFILAPKPTTAERIAADVQAGITRWSHETWNPKTAVTIAEVLVERGYKHPEET